MRFALLAGALALWASSARAQLPQPFVPSDQPQRPWEAGQVGPGRGMGEYVGSAALPGKGRLLIVQKDATTQTYVVPRTRVFDASGRPLPQSAITEGAKVKVDFDAVGNTNIARRVTILAPPEPLPAAPPVAAP